VMLLQRRNINSRVDRYRSRRSRVRRIRPAAGRRSIAAGRIRPLESARRPFKVELECRGILLDAGHSSCIFSARINISPKRKREKGGGRQRREMSEQATGAFEARVNRYRKFKAVGGTRNGSEPAVDLLLRRIHYYVGIVAYSASYGHVTRDDRALNTRRILRNLPFAVSVSEQMVAASNAQST